MVCASRLVGQWGRTARRFLTSSIVAAATLAMSFPATSVVHAAPAGDAVLWGAYVNGAPYDVGLLDAIESKIGKKMPLVHWGQPWLRGSPFQSFPPASMQRVS